MGRPGKPGAARIEFRPLAVNHGARIMFHSSRRWDLKLAENLIDALSLLALSLLTAAIGMGILQLVMGPLFQQGSLRRKKRLAGWTSVTRSLWASLPASLLVVGGTILFRRVVPSINGVGLASPGLFLGGCAVVTSGCLLLLDAGRLERRGRLFLARRQCRRAGLTTSAGLLMLITLVLVFPSAGNWVGAPWETSPSPTTLLGGTGLLGGSALAGLLAGLSGKPRPSGWLAGLLYSLGLLVLITGGRVATHM
jgi:hypothetical protein